MSKLLTPVRIGRYVAPNGLVMAPMTRSRADDNGVPIDLTLTYYAQRASAGLIISEGVFPSAMGKGYVHTPGIETEAQVAAWKKVTEAVHARGGRIFMQLMHCGRVSHPSLLNGATPVAPSAIQPAGQAWTPAGQVDFVTPRELTVAEIAGVVDDYRQATRRALEAGFDGLGESKGRPLAEIPGTPANGHAQITDSPASRSPQARHHTRLGVAGRTDSRR